VAALKVAWLDWPMFLVVETVGFPSLFLRDHDDFTVKTPRDADQHP